MKRLYGSHNEMDRSNIRDQLIREITRYQTQQLIFWPKKKNTTTNNDDKNKISR